MKDEKVNKTLKTFLYVAICEGLANSEKKRMSKKVKGVEKR